MSVIIKGMDMPSSCANCNGCVNIGVLSLCVLGDMFIDDDTQIDPDCPLVEIPSGHGRLIDVGKIPSTVGYYRLASGEQLEKHFYEIEYIKNAPTILDAEGEEK